MAAAVTIESLTIDELKLELSRLDAGVREELVHFLIDSLGDDPDTRTNEEFEADLKRRLAAIRSGTAIGESADVVMKRVRERFS
jgi:putative addiction module component (TIGR02574 family)